MRPQISVVYHGKRVENVRVRCIAAHVISECRLLGLSADETIDAVAAAIEEAAEPLVHGLRTLKDGGSDVADIALDAWEGKV